MGATGGAVPAAEAGSIRLLLVWRGIISFSTPQSKLHMLASHKDGHNIILVFPAHSRCLLSLSLFL